MNKIIIIVGLPGSGKTTFLNSEFGNHDNLIIFDDYKASAVLNCSDFTYSKNYPELINQICSAEKDIVISDISFCNFESFIQSKEIIEWWIEQSNNNYIIRIIIFENDPEKCIENVKKDTKKRNVDDRINKIKEFSPNFFPKKYIIDGEIQSIGGI
jgi:GTPase SAR1 family protein